MYNEQQKNEAKKLFIAGKKIIEIEELIGIQRRTLYNWINTENWGEGLSEINTISFFHRRLIELSAIQEKTVMQLQEMKVTIECIERLERIEKSKKQTEKEPREKSEKKRQLLENDFSEIDAEKATKDFLDTMFGYQKICWSNRKERVRFILKSRQIGMTYYFSGEALIDGILSGQNKIFLSASRNQADVFREYILGFCKILFSKEPKGKNKITLKLAENKEVTFYFLSTNSATAQSFHGDVYIDECFWIPNFAKMRTVAAAMASQKQYHVTYFSTPSSTAHEAYPLWTGKDLQDKLKKRNQPLAVFPRDHELENGGVKCPDTIWRFRIPISVAEKYGCNLFNIQDLKNEYSENEFTMLYNCEFVNDNSTVFKWEKLQKCTCDSQQWKDIDWSDNRNYLGKVWIGYDPARSSDAGSIVIIIPPEQIGGKFRILDKIYLKNVPWSDQAKFIKKLTEKYFVEKITIDKTGIGQAVYEMIQEFFPAVRGIDYSVDEKNLLINKMSDVFDKERILWDASFSDISGAFLQIRRSITNSGKMSFVSSRSEATGHADIAWAIMHAVSNENLIISTEKLTQPTLFSFSQNN